jgi:CPA2 family monovalent cation:H+ antiporter-2
MPISMPIMLAAEVTGESIALDLLAILAAAGMVAVLARRLRVATIPLYLIAGALIGPHALGLATPTEADSIKSLSTVLLMFTIGLHLDINSLRGGLVSIALLTVLSTLGVTGIGWGIGVGMGLPAPEALLAAMAISISSTAVVLRVMEERRELHAIQGRLTLGTLVLQDMLSLLMLALIPLLAGWARSRGVSGGMEARPPGSWVAMASKVAISIGGVSALIVIGRWGLPRVMRIAARSGEALLVVSAAVALAAAVATAALGFSPELGAFLAGFLLASTPFRYQIAGQLIPLRDLFLAVFFTAIGLGLPLSELARDWWLLLIGLAATIGVKSLVTSGTAWAVGASAPVAIYCGVAMAQGGEFSLVMLSVAEEAGAISHAHANSVIAVIVLSLVATPWLIGRGARLGSRAHAIRHAPWIGKSAFRDVVPAGDGEEPRISEVAPAAAEAAVAGSAQGKLAIVAGFGPVGRAVVDNLEKRGVVVTVIELNPKTVEKQHRLGRAIVYGDAGNLEVLEQAGLSRSSAIVLTMPDEEAVLRACSVIRKQHPEIFVAARLNVLSKGLQAMGLGADHVVIEEMATAEAMASQVLIKLEQREAGEDTGPKLYEFQR